MSSLLRLIRGPCISEVPLPHCRGLWLAPLTSQCSTAVPELRPGFSPVSQSGNPKCQRHWSGTGNPEDTTHRPRVGHPTNSKPHVGLGQPEGCKLPSSIVQGLGFTDVSHTMCLLGPLPMANFFIGLDFLPPVSVGSDTIPLSISSKIQQLGSSTGSCIPLSHDWDWDQAAEGLAGTFGWAPPLWVGQHLGPSLGGSHGGSTEKGIEGEECLLTPWLCLLLWRWSVLWAG